MPCCSLLTVSQLQVQLLPDQPFQRSAASGQPFIDCLQPNGAPFQAPVVRRDRRHRSSRPPTRLQPSSTRGACSCATWRMAPPRWVGAAPPCESFTTYNPTTCARSAVLTKSNLTYAPAGRPGGAAAALRQRDGGAPGPGQVSCCLGHCMYLRTVERRCWWNGTASVSMGCDARPVPCCRAPDRPLHSEP